MDCKTTYAEERVKEYFGWVARLVSVKEWEHPVWDGQYVINSDNF